MAKDKKTAQELKKQRQTYDYKTPMTTIEYQVDTIAAESSTAGAYFSTDYNSITINYEENKDNQINESKATKAHENQHKINHQKQIEENSMNLEQYYKICCHNEISANITGLLHLREEYKKAKTDKEREKIINSPSGLQFEYYFDAIKSGWVNPHAQTSAEFDDEMEFIARNTKNMWMSRFSNGYDKNHCAMVSSYLATHDYKDLASNTNNYEKSRKNAYNIGGIDFTQYMGDIECINPNIKIADKKISENKPRSEVMQSVVEVSLGLNKGDAGYYSCNYDVLRAQAKLKGQNEEEMFHVVKPQYQFNPKLSPEEQLNAAQHQLLFENIKAQNPVFFANVKNFDEWMNVQQISNKVFSEPNLDSYTYKYYMDEVKKEKKEEESVPYPLRAEQKTVDDVLDEFSFQDGYLRALAQRHAVIGVEIINNYNEKLEKQAEHRKKMPDYMITYFKNVLEAAPGFSDEWNAQVNGLIKDVNEYYAHRIQIPSGNKEEYQKQLDKVYTADGYNYKDIMTSKPDIQQLARNNGSVESKEALVTVSLPTRVAGAIGYRRKRRLSGVDKEEQNSTEDIIHAQKEEKPYYYHGAPLYGEWSKDNRVSEVKTEKIYDFSQPFLLDQYNTLRKNEGKEPVGDAKEDSKPMMLASTELNKIKFDLKLDKQVKQKKEEIKVPLKAKKKSNLGFETEWNKDKTK